MPITTKNGNTKPFKTDKKKNGNNPESSKEQETHVTHRDTRQQTETRLSWDSLAMPVSREHGKLDKQQTIYVHQSRKSI